MSVAAKMPENEIKSELGLAYVHAVASRLGCACQKSERQTDNMGVDLTLRFKGDFGQPIGYRSPVLDIQVKSTAVPLANDSQGRGIVFDGISQSVYDDFRDENRVVPAILVLFALPENPDDWLYLDEDQLLLKRCAYWVSLRGATGNMKRIFIPRTQLFCVDQLRDVILTTLAQRNELRYAN